MTQTLPPRDEIEAFECVHVSYVQATDGSPNDALIVKELVHCKDGRVLPNVRIIQNYERDFYVTLEPYRTHKDKRPWEQIKRTRKFRCRQHELHNKVARALGRTPGRNYLRQLARSPYLYGVDITTPVLLKRSYRDKWPRTPSPYTVAAYDVETSMTSDEQEIILSSMTCKNKGVLTILRSFMQGKDEAAFVQGVRDKIQQYIGDIVKQRNLEIEIRVVDTPAGCVKTAFDRAHEWKPDYVSIFNIDFDMPKSIKTLEDEGIPLNDVFCDPSVPPQYRAFEYVKGPTVKKDEEGNTTPINVHDQWHTCRSQASFLFADSMLLYKRIRTAAPNEPSYSLDYILQKNLGLRKLKFTEADGYEKGEWHTFMQANYPEEYCVYNLFDTISLEMLDEKTKDISVTLTALLKCSEYHNYNSQPKMVADDLHFFGLKRGNIFGSTSDNMKTELDSLSPNLRNWIVTLPAYMVADNEAQVVSEMMGHQTLAWTHVSDVDVVSTYPNLQDALNIDKMTTQTELSSVEGYREEEWRHAGIDLTGGFVNHTMICQKMFKLPDMQTLLTEFQEELDDQTEPDAKPEPERQAA